MKTCDNPFQRGALCKLCSVEEPVGGDALLQGRRCANSRVMERSRVASASA